MNIESIRRQVNHALLKPGQQGHNDAYAEAERMAEELAELTEQARMAIETGDGETALDVLAAITEELANGRWADLLLYDVPLCSRWSTISARRSSKRFSQPS